MIKAIRGQTRTSETETRTPPKAVENRGQPRVRTSQQFQIGNNRGGINGWISRGEIYGILVGLE